ncbi:hypothetical protein HZQ75_16160 [Elizabethkingia anophelis]|uniref:DUF3575 domain-containing protein n=1 Tax=Elizabethkingia anophelis R26 TaxID=1246994 RepID=A0ABM6MUR9_9FLAO|nr:MULTISPECIES: hypothetical protein [Elizabethkingia]ATC36916.1 hypothetical protein BAZ09_012100 [Elizabethkingia anophelis R26]ATC40594.1 hypothetical protein EAAG1_012315 [Elizabethkingia anophelis Ag1]ATC44272.1 hypothetical protein CMV41_12315 [Elizabethkingia anophelis]ATC47948.1 hypothetical protein CMV40_12315 [Elizabethkingia anophelis]ELR80092.1 hypothetical protein D505_06373 [Elizabethkingia anophelis R26]
MKAKVISIFFFLSIINITFAQENNQNNSNLRDFFKIEIFVDKVNLGYELPISDKFLIDFAAGVSAANDFRDGTQGIKWVDNGTSYLGLFFRGQVRYYFNRNSREKRGHSLVNNAGSFLGFQSKYNFNGNKDIGKVLLNELHFGQQLPLGKKIFFRYHAGVGYGYNFGEKYNSIYPALGLVLGYAF